MATRLTNDHRNIIGKKLTNRLGLALKQGEIDAKGASQACKMILSLIDTFEYVEQLHALLQKLAQGWPFFGEVLEFEEKTEKASQSIDSMFQNRNVQYIGSSY